MDSVIGQTLKDIEIICVDDGSTDGSAQILDEYAKKDKRIKIITQVNQGASCSRNNALTKASGEYIVFVDSEDYLHKDTLNILYKQVITHNLDILLFGAAKFSDSGRELASAPDYQFNYLPENFNADCFNYKQCEKFMDKITSMVFPALYKKSFIESHNIVFPPHLFFGDNAFFTHAFLTASKCGICKKPLYFQRMHSQRITPTMSEYYGDYLQICQKVVDLTASLPIGNSLKTYYLHLYIEKVTGIFNNFSKKDQYRYLKQFKTFIKRNINKQCKVIKYLLFGFIPLLSIEEK